MKKREQKQSSAGVPFDPHRRDFGRVALTSTLSAAGFFVPAGERSVSSQVNRSGSRIKLCAQSSARPTDEQLLFLKQIGAEYVSVGAPRDLRTAEGFMQIKKRYADAGITVWNIGNTDVHNMPEVTLNLPGRDAKIEEYKQYLRNLGEAGIHYTTYAHMGNGIWSSGRAPIRGADAREFDLSSPNRKGVWDGKTWQEPLSHGRVFTEGRDLGQLHLFHQAGGPRRGGGRCTDRDPSRRSAGAGARRSSALHLQQLRGLQARAWRSPTARMSGSACAAAPGSKAAASSRARTRRR